MDVSNETYRAYHCGRLHGIGCLCWLAQRRPVPPVRDVAYALGVHPDRGRSFVRAVLHGTAPGLVKGIQ